MMTSSAPKELLQSYNNIGQETIPRMLDDGLTTFLSSLSHPLLVTQCLQDCPLVYTHLLKALTAPTSDSALQSDSEQAISP